MSGPWYFRQARPASRSWNLAKTALQIVLFWGTFLFVLPPLVVEFGTRLGVPVLVSPLLKNAGALLFVAASLLGLASAATMASLGDGTPLPLDSPRRLVTTGPYAWVRNPMAVAGLTQGFAVALWHGSIAVVIYVVIGGLIRNHVARPLEEQDLVRIFGREFTDYRDRVPIWIPRRPH